MRADWIRLAGFYAAYFAVIGVTQPFWPVWLAAQGLGGSEIGVLLSSVLWVRVLTNPLLAQFADRQGDRRSVMLPLAAAALAGYVGFAFAAGFWWLLALSLVVGITYSATLPMADALVLARVYASGLDYGRLRLWGSVAFIVTSVGIGHVVGVGGERPILIAVIALLALAIGGIAALPRAAGTVERPSGSIILYLLARPAFLVFVLADSLIMSSHAVLTGFASLHWRAAGIDDGVVGALWAVGVVAEIALFSLSNRIVVRLDVTGLLRLAAAGALVRWLLAGASTALPLLLLAQTLHGLTFGAAHLATMHFIARAVPPGMTATAQSLNSACGSIAMGLALLGSGWLFDRFGGGAFYAMALVAAAALGATVPFAKLWRGQTL